MGEKKKMLNLTKEQRVSKLISDATKIVGAKGPVEIANPEAYKEFVDLCNHPIFHPPLNTMKLSNGETVKIGGFPHNIRAKLYDIPPEEEAAVWKRKKIYSDNLNKRNAKLSQAYKMVVVRTDGTLTKLSQFSQREQQMIELFGRMFSLQEVHQMCLTEWQIPVGIKAIEDFRTAHWKEIEQKIEVHKRDYSDIRLGYKRSRLEELSWMYITRKNIYQATLKADDHRLLLQTIEQIRKEVEGDTIRFDGKITLDIETTIENHIRKELFKGLPLKEVILARIAARTGVPTDFLINDLNRSYYGAFLNGSVEDIAHEELPLYPSNQEYDFTAIKEFQAKEVEAVESKKIQIKKVETQNNSSGSSLKDALLSMLKKKKESIDFTESQATNKNIDKRNSGDVTTNYGK